MVGSTSLSKQCIARSHTVRYFLPVRLCDNTHAAPAASASKRSKRHVTCATQRPSEVVAALDIDSTNSTYLRRFDRQPHPSELISVSAQCQLIHSFATLNMWIMLQFYFSLRRFAFLVSSVAAPFCVIVCQRTCFVCARAREYTQCTKTKARCKRDFSIITIIECSWQRNAQSAYGHTKLSVYIYQRKQNKKRIDDKLVRPL